MYSTEYSSTGLEGLFTLPVIIIYIALVALMIVVMWKIYVKAGKPGWAVLIPFYREYCFMEITWGNGWLFLLYIVPVVGAIVGIITVFKLASAFGKGAGFGFGLLFLSIIFYPILAFSDAEYIGPQ